jgi:hypothetical protein
MRYLPGAARPPDLATAETQWGQSGFMTALYYRGPSEPGGDDDIIAEVVGGKLRRSIEISRGVALCTGFDDYPVTVDMADVADYVWPISEQEFNDAWLRHCS